MDQAGRRVGALASSLPEIDPYRASDVRARLGRSEDQHQTQVLKKVVGYALSSLQSRRVG